MLFMVFWGVVGAWTGHWIGLHSLARAFRLFRIDQLDIQPAARGALDEVVVFHVGHELRLLELVAAVLAREVWGIHRCPPVRLLRVFHQRLFAHQLRLHPARFRHLVGDAFFVETPTATVRYAGGEGRLHT